MNRNVSYQTPFGDVSFSLFENNSGISCSGGADSTILLYLLALEKLPLRVFYLENANSKYEALENCVQFINESCDTSYSIEIIKRTGQGNFIRPEILFMSEIVEYLYTGVTKNPPVQVHDTGIPNRPATNNTTNIITPFLNVDKRVPIYLYKLMNVPKLLELTYTCTQNSESPCNNCFACKEKTWAIEENNKL